MFALGFKGAAGRGAPEIVEDRAALGQEGLPVGVGGEALAGLDVLVKALLFPLVHHQGQAKAVRQHLLGQIVAGGAEAAGGDDDVGAGLCHLHARPQALGIVAHDGVVLDIDADFGKPLGNVAGVGVGDVAQQKLGADAEDLGIKGSLHSRSRSFPIRPALR